MTNLNDSGQGNNTGAPQQLQQAPPAAINALKLPSINDLYGDTELSTKQNALNILLSQPPNPSWLKQHPYITTKDAAGNNAPYYYIPIQRIEWLLTSIFIKWRKEVREVKQLANSVVVTMRLHYQDPITGEWEFMDGVGATDIQTKKGASAADFSQIVPAAIQKGLPAAASYALKDAAEGLGRIFGKDLNRADMVGYQNLQQKEFNNQPLND